VAMHVVEALVRFDARNALREIHDVLRQPIDEVRLYVCAARGQAWRAACPGLRCVPRPTVPADYVASGNAFQGILQEKSAC
jgi:hypothetical protein